MVEQSKQGCQEATEAVDASQWFVKSFKIPEPMQALLEQYSGFSPNEIIPHVTDLVSDIQPGISSQN